MKTVEMTLFGRSLTLVTASVVFAQVLEGQARIRKPVPFDIPLRLMLLRWCDPVTGRHATTTPISLN